MPFRISPFRSSALAAALLLTTQVAARPALAHEDGLAGAPAAQPLSAGWDRDGWRGRGRDGKGECWAQVRYPAAASPPATGPEYIWTRQPGPPGSPGPIWCLTVQPFPPPPIIERLGWIRVLCADQASAPRIAEVQRRLHAHGVYHGRMDGRFDAETGDAVRSFQAERHIEHRGYLSYETMDALWQAPPPPPPRIVYVRRLTTFDTGYIDWPGKVRY